MDEEFNFLEYPLVDIIFQQWMTHGDNIKTKEVQGKIYSEICIYLSYVLQDNDDFQFLDYKLKIDKLGDCIEIKAMNIVTALWFISIFPLEPSLTYKDNQCYTEDGLYTFDKKTKKLIWTKEV